jgi:THO complex subunit 5
MDTSEPLLPSPEAALDELRALVGDDANTSVDQSLARVRSGALFARLKALNRAANTATREHKQRTADARQEMDATALGLQNLLYEKRHLEREIEKCRQFNSVYQDIPLYNEEEFMQLAPEDSRTEEILVDEHRLMLARLNFELAERQRLEAFRKKLARDKEDLLKHSAQKQATMDTVKSQIDTLVKSATEIQHKVDSLVPAAPSPEPSSASESTEKGTPLPAS